MKGVSKTDAIHSARIVIKKYREKQKKLHAAFLDLEKAFDKVPYGVIWWALRKHRVPEEYVQWIKLIYHNASSHVQTAAGQSKEFQIKVGVHQGSVLSPLLFITVMNAVIKSLRREPPWTLFNADDVVFIPSTRKELQDEVQD